MCVCISLCVCVCVSVYIHTPVIIATAIIPITACMYPPPHMTCMYPPPHMTSNNTNYGMHVSSSSYDIHDPPPHRACMYPPPHMTIPITACSCAQRTSLVALKKLSEVSARKCQKRPSKCQKRPSKSCCLEEIVRKVTGSLCYTFFAKLFTTVLLPSQKSVPKRIYYIKAL